MKNRSELREVIMKVLYQIYIFQDTNLVYQIDELIKEQLDVENDYVKQMIYGITTEEQRLESLADQYLLDWQMSRLNKVDRAIFNLGIYELLYTETPSVVAINEAIELSKKYSDEKVTKMLNAVLDQIYHNEARNEG